MKKKAKHDASRFFRSYLCACSNALLLPCHVPLLGQPQSPPGLNSDSLHPHIHSTCPLSPLPLPVLASIGPACRFPPSLVSLFFSQSTLAQFLVHPHVLSDSPLLLTFLLALPPPPRPSLFCIYLLPSSIQHATRPRSYGTSTGSTP